MSRTVKIKSLHELKKDGHSVSNGRIHAPVGERFSYPFSLEEALPRHRTITIQNDNTWHHDDKMFKIGNWMIRDAIDDQAKDHGG